MKGVRILKSLYRRLEAFEKVLEVVKDTDLRAPKEWCERCMEETRSARARKRAWLRARGE